MCGQQQYYIPEKHRLPKSWLTKNVLEKLGLEEQPLLLRLIKAFHLILYYTYKKQLFKNKLWQYKKVQLEDSPQRIP
jgi:hypothetical protein